MSSKNRILSFVLSLVMVLGVLNPVAAARLSANPRHTSSKTEIEGTNKNGKLVFDLSGQFNSRRRLETMSGFRRNVQTTFQSSNPGYNQNKVIVKINLQGVNGKEFPFTTIFPRGAKVKLELFDDDTLEEIVSEKVFTSNGQELDFGIFEQNQIQNISIMLGDVKVAGKIIEDTVDGIEGETGVTTYILNLYQYVNTDVVVKTVDKTGASVTNPSSKNTGGKIKATVKSETKEIDIPEGSVETETFAIDSDINLNTIANFQSKPTIEITGLQKGVLVDKKANKVYKPEPITPDPNGINATEVKFTEKPLTTTDDMSGDTDYVKVTFNPGKYGTIADTKPLYVFKGAELEKEPTPPTVTPNKGWKHEGWNPVLAKVYNDPVTDHVAQYKPVEATGQTINTTVGHAPKAEEGIGNKDSLPDGTTYEWIAPPDVSKKGNSTGKIKVTYPDNSTQEVEVTVIVGDNEAMKYVAIGGEIKKDYGVATTDQEVLDKVTTDYPTGNAEQPTKKIKAGQTLPDGKESGNFSVIVEVTYPDKSVDEATVTIKVADKNSDTYTASSTVIEKGYGVPTTKAEVIAAVSTDYPSNLSKQPKVELANNATLPDGKISGQHNVPVVVTYPDGTQDNLDVIVNVAKSSAELINEAGGLKPVDIEVFVNEDIEWKKGVDFKKANVSNEVRVLLTKAEITDLDGRNSSTVGDKKGSLSVKFEDGSEIIVTEQYLKVKPKNISVNFDDKKPGDNGKAPRHNEEVVKGKVVAGAGTTLKDATLTIKDESGNVIGTTLVKDDGSFIAGTRKLIAGEKIYVEVLLTNTTNAAKAGSKIVKLNPDRINELLPIAKAQKENFSKKQNAFIKSKLETLNTAITEAEKLVDNNGKAIGEDKFNNQEAINTAVTNLENALKALTANIPPSISGPKTHEIFVGEDLDLKALVDVTDGDGADDLVVENGSNVKIDVVKVYNGISTPITDLSTINKTVGTYKVTYTAKDKAGAQVTQVIELTVKERTISKIEVTTDPSNMSYLIKEKGKTAKLNLDGMSLNLVDNLGKKTEVKLNDPKLKLKVNGRDVTNGADLTLADDVKFIEVEYTLEGSQTPLTAKTDGVLRVGPDYDKDGKDDRTQNFDEKNIKELEVIKQPQLDYIAKDKSEDSKFKLNLEGMIVRMTDKAGKEKLAVVSNGKFVDYDDNKTAITVLTATPAHGATLTPETSATETGDNGKTVKITGPNNSKAETEKLKVFYDANKDGKPDHGKDQKTPAPSAMARNIGENPQGTTVEGMATPGAVIKIYKADDQKLENPLATVVAEKDGKYTTTVKPILADKTDIKVTAKLGEMGESDPTPTTVFDDKNDNKQPDRDEGFNIEKATDIKFATQPDLTYLVPSKDTEVTFDGKDGKGNPIFLELSYKNGDKTESKIIPLEELMKDTTHISVTPANGTKDKIGNNPANLVGKAIDVKLVKADKTATSTSKFAIKVDANNNGIADEEETTATPTVKARNIGEKPTKTTVEGTAPKGSTVTIKYTLEGGQETTKTVTAGDDGKYTAEIEPKLPVDTEVKVTAKDGEKKVSPEVKTKVFEDKDNDGEDDKSQNFDIAKADKIEVVYDPAKMNYLVTSKDGKVALETRGMVVKVTDKAGVEKKFTAEEIAADTTHFTVEPADGTEIGLANHDKPIKVTLNVQGASVTEAETNKLSVKLDADNNGIADEDEKSAKAENVKALNQNKVVDGKVTNEPKDTTTVTGKAKAGSTVIIKNEAGDQIGKFEKVPSNGEFTAEVTKQEEGKKVQVIVTEPGKQDSDPTDAIVARDANNDGKADNDANQKTATPTAKALNVGKEPKVTTITGKAEPNAKVVAKVDETIVGTATADNNGDYKIEATKTGKADGGALDKDTEVKVTAQAEGKLVSDPTATVVKIDKDGNGVDDDKEKFDIKKATKVEILQNPDKMNYSVTEKTGTTPFDATGVIIRLTDGSDKTATYTYADITEGADKGKFALSPADKEQIGLKENGSVNTIPFKVTVTGAETKPTVTAEQNITVILDKDGNGVDDRTEKTPEPDVIARNIGKDPQKTTVEIETEPKAKVTIEYTDKQGHPQKIENLTAGEDGKLTQEITPKLDKGTPVKVTVKDGEKQPTEKTVKVFDDLDNNRIPDDQAGQTERPAALASNIGKKPEFTTITGEAEKGAIVTAYVGTEVVGTATADSETGKYTIQAKQNNAPIKEGVKVDVTAILAPKTESLKQTVVVFNDTDGTGQPDSSKNFDPKKATGMQVVASPDKMVYTDGDQLNLDGLKVLLTDVNGNQKIFTYNNAKNDEFIGAGLSVDYKQGVKLTNDDNGKKLTVTLDTTGNNQVTKAITGETPTALTVNKKQSAQPTDVVAANQGDAKVTKVKGKATKDAEIKITDADGNSLLPEGTAIKADANGDFTADLNKLLDPGTKVYFTATEPGKSESPKAETSVIRDKDGNWKADTGSKLSTPVIDPIRENDEKVVVEAPVAKDKIQTITVEDQNGNTVTLTKDATGNTWTVKGSTPVEKVTEEGGKIAIPVKDKLPLNDRDQIKVTFKDGENPANEAFNKEAVKKASQKPTVDPVYTGEKEVKIVDPTLADPTAKTLKVKVNDNDTMTIEKQNDGTWKNINKPNDKVKVDGGKVIVPLDPSAKKNDVIKVSTVNESKVESPQEEVIVEDKVPTEKPTIKDADKDTNFVTGTAAPNAEVTITVTPKGGEPKTFTGKADGDGKYKVTTDPLVDGDKVVAKASEPGKADNTSEPKTVGVKTSELQKSIEKAEEPTIGGKDGVNLDDKKPIDKELKDALEKGKDVKEKGDKGDPSIDQGKVDDAKKELDKAIAQKEADTAVDKAKDNPSPANIDDAQKKIDAIPGSKDQQAPDYNPIKKELQDKLDLIKKIKEGEDRLKQDDVTGANDTPTKPQKEIDKLKNAIQDGKDALNKNEKDKYGEKTTEIEKAINILNQESITVGIKTLKVGDQSIEIVTSVDRVSVEIWINDKLIDTIVTNAYGNYKKGLSEPIAKGTKIELKAIKTGYNDGSFRRTIRR